MGDTRAERYGLNDLTRDQVVALTMEVCRRRGMDKFDTLVATECIGRSYDLEKLYAEIDLCTKCEIRRGCKAPVNSDGDPIAQLMIVGEGPGEQEDQQGLPFVGPAGQLLNAALAKAQIKRGLLFITNVIRCRPPQNRDPKADEIENCFPNLLREIEIVRPRVILAFGRHAASALIHEDFKITKERGQWFDFNGIPVIATYHPAYILRKVGRDEIIAKTEFLQDLLAAARKADEKTPEALRLLPRS